jgi:hypothetical protein
MNIVPSIEVSSVFDDNGTIPALYSCQGRQINPPLSIRNIPNGTQSMVLIMDDPDAPVGTWTQWLVFNIPPISGILPDSIPGIEGTNSFGDTSYHGPCPLSGVDRYFFRIYALDKNLTLTSKATRNVVEDAMDNHILGTGYLFGVYSSS